MQKLMDLGLDYARYLHFDGSNELLLELSRGATKYDFVEYERTIYEPRAGAIRSSSPIQSAAGLSSRMSRSPSAWFRWVASSGIGRLYSWRQILAKRSVRA